MFSREQVAQIVSDIFRTELVKRRQDAFAFFDDTQLPLDLSQLPPEICQEAAAQVGRFFDIEPGAFATLDELSVRAYDAYQRQQRVYLSTSGSTGQPNYICYPRCMLEEEARVVGAHFQNAKRLVTLTPRQHLYGLSFAVLFASYYHIPCVALPPLPLQPWETLLQAGDVVAGFPLFWEYFLRAGKRFPGGVTAVTSTAPCPKGLFERLQQAGAEQIAELYGATETGGIGVRYRQEDPFVINNFWTITFTADQRPMLSRTGIAGPVPFPDEVKFVPPRSVFPVKRMDKVVQVAGVNVSLTGVEHIIRQHPAVKACVVRLMRPEEGHRLKAFLVLNDGYTADDLPAIRRYLSGRLSSHEMSRSFTVGDDLPRNAMGKACDW